MKIFFLFFLISFVAACNNSDKDYRKPENALDAGREFIDHSLKGRFNVAKRYMLQDADNIYWLDKVSGDYNKYSQQEKVGYSSASIRISEVADVNDSVTIINFKNTYTNRPQKVKVLKINHEWLVDFKYTFSGNQ
jgi:hypothetical protein